MDETCYWWDRRYPRHTWIYYTQPGTTRAPEEHEAAIRGHIERIMRQLKEVPDCTAEEEDSLIEALRVDWAGTVRQLKERGWQGLGGSSEENSSDQM